MSLYFDILPSELLSLLFLHEYKVNKRRNRN